MTCWPDGNEVILKLPWRGLKLPLAGIEDPEIAVPVPLQSVVHQDVSAGADGEADICEISLAPPVG